MPVTPKFIQTAVTDARLLAYRDAVASLYLNGRVILTAYRRISGPAARFGLHNPASAAPALFAFFAAAPDIPPLEPPGQPAYCLLGPYELEGALAEILLEGGAYRRFEDAPAARQLAIAAVDALAGLDRMALRAYFSRAAWSGWFMVGPWDRTVISVDPAADVWTLFCATDTDWPAGGRISRKCQHNSYTFLTNT